MYSSNIATWSACYGLIWLLQHHHECIVFCLRSWLDLWYFLDPDRTRSPIIVRWGGLLEGCCMSSQSTGRHSPRCHCVWPFGCRPCSAVQRWHWCVTATVASRMTTYVRLLLGVQGRYCAGNGLVVCAMLHLSMLGCLDRHNHHACCEYMVHWPSQGCTSPLLFTVFSYPKWAYIIMHFSTIGHCQYGTR